MKILYFSLKGGVGKSSIALNHAIENGYTYVTNDITSPTDRECIDDFHQIPHNTKRIPKHLLALENVIFDFGAMSSVIDSKVTHAVRHCDGVVIPTLTDARSIEATIQTYELIKNQSLKIAIIINNYQKDRKYIEAFHDLTYALKKPKIFAIKHTTLFDRVAKDGTDWYSKIGCERGEYRLVKTKLQHQKVYEQINQYTEKK